MEVRVELVCSGVRTRTSCTHERTCVRAANALTNWASQTNQSANQSVNRPAVRDLTPVSANWPKCPRLVLSANWPDCELSSPRVDHSVRELTRPWIDQSAIWFVRALTSNHPRHRSQCLLPWHSLHASDTSTALPIWERHAAYSCALLQT